MSLNKKILATAVLASLAASASAVILSPAASNVPSKYPTELVITGGRLPIVNGAANQLDITSAFNYAFSAGEVRYARVECSSGVEIETGSVTTTDTDADVNTSLTAGALNGLGTSVVTFSVTAGPAGSGPGASFTLTGDRSISSVTDATCSFALYDTPSQASFGGDSGKILSSAVTGNYLDFVNAYSMTSSGTDATANVEASGGAYTGFISGDTALTSVSLGRFKTQLTTGLYEADGSDLTFAEIVGATSKHIVSGDFTFVANDDATYTGAALTRVWLDTSVTNTCSYNAADGDLAAASITATSATFNTGNLPRDVTVCVTAEGTPAINEAEYRVLWDVVAASSKYATPDIGPQLLGKIVRNGTQIQAPLVQTPSGYLSRIALTNSGTAQRAYTVRVINEEGNATTLNSAALNGFVNGNSTKVIDVGSIITGYTTATRATIIVTVAAPNTQIQGLYQIVNPAMGSISNHVMVRPGTN